jgi:putative tryptophan/tyrosine transport system substrate-binding protein
MRRREFIAGMLLMPALERAQAQPYGKAYRIAFLRAAAPQERDFAAFKKGLEELGYVEGRDIVIEARHANGIGAHLPALASELVQLKPDVIVVDGDMSVRAAQAATATHPVPIVFAIASDPVGAGFAASLWRPGGMTTGLSNISVELSGKRVDLLKAALPRLTRLVMLAHPERLYAPHRKQVEETARALAIDVVPVLASTPDELAVALDSLRGTQADAFLSLYSPLFFSQRMRIVEAVNGSRIPALYPEREFVEAGGLMSYGVDFQAQWRRTASYVHRILRGGQAGELPIEQPARLELVVNARLLRMLDLRLSPALLTLADEVIE